MRWRTPASAYTLRVGNPPISAPFDPVVVPDDNPTPLATVTTTHPNRNAYTTYTHSATVPLTGEGPGNVTNQAQTNGHQPTALAQAMAGQPAPLQHDALGRLQANPLLNQSARDADGFPLAGPGHNSSLSLLPMAGDILLHRSADQLDKVSGERSSLPRSRSLSQVTGRGGGLVVPMADNGDKSDSSMRVQGQHTPAMQDTSDDDDSDAGNRLPALAQPLETLTTAVVDGKHVFIV